MKKIILFTLVLCTAWYIQAQGFDYNQEKYWKYREILKNFVVPGDCQGCSLPAAKIDLAGEMDHGDETQSLGSYIGFLALEHKLLRTQTGSGYSGSTDANTKELFYALEAFNRLDKMAESYFVYYGYNATGYTPNLTNDLNGFFIRDDIPYDWLDQVYNGQSIENTLGDHYGPFDWHNTPYLGVNLTDKDKYRRKMRQVQTEFTRKDYLNKSYPSGLNGARYGGPTEESLDQIIEFIKGISLTVKMLDPSLTYVENGATKQFSDGETNIVSEAKKISGRITTWCKKYNWQLTNPVTGTCVKGLHPESMTCMDAGADFYDLCAGFAMADAWIQTGFTSQASANNYFNSQYSMNVGIQASLDFINSYYSNFTLDINQDNKVLTLAALSDIWGSQTKDILADRSLHAYTHGRETNFPHIPLMHALLFDEQTGLSNTMYECMLDNAAYDGQHMWDANYTWSGAVMAYGPDPNGTTYSDEQFGVDYMFIHNAYCLYNTAYMHNSYARIDPLQLLPINLIKTGQKIADPNTGLIQPYKEWDFRRYAATRFITVGNINNFGEYHIRQYDGDAAGLLPSDQLQDICRPTKEGNYITETTANGTVIRNVNNQSGTCEYDQLEAQDETFVEFLAGAAVVFKPGFEISHGGQMHAHIQQGLGNMAPNDPDKNAQCTECRSGGDERRNTSYISDDSYRVYQFVSGEMFVVTPHVIFKVRDKGHVGPNMFTLEENSPYDCPTVYQSVDYMKGFQRFDHGHSIIDVDYIQGHTLVCFDDGMIIKIAGTGGTGEDMFELWDNGSGFQGLGNTYFEGFCFFRYGELVKMASNGNDVLIAINLSSAGISGKILKLNGIGGSYLNGGGVAPDNFWGINETQTGFTIGGNVLGYQQFSGKISAMEFVNNNLYVCTRNGSDNYAKILKVSGSGGTGYNMFDITELSGSDAFEDDTYYGGNYYMGDQKFGHIASYVKSLYSFPYNSHTYIALGLKNGKVLIVKDGGTGHYMFNVDEYNSTFAVHDNSYTDYRLAFQDFSNGTGTLGNEGYVEDFEWVQDAGGGTPYLFMGFHNGQLRKTDLSGASTVAPGSIGNVTGFSDFNQSVANITQIDNETFVGLSDGNIVAVRGSAGSGNNFMALDYVQTGVTSAISKSRDYFTGLCGYDYYIGSENFSEACAGKKAIRIDTTSNAYYERTNADSAQLAYAEALLDKRNNAAVPDFTINVWPNPANSSLNIMITGNGEAEIEVDDVTGHSLNKIMVNLNRHAELNVTGLGPGMYYLKCRNMNSGLSKTAKFIKQ